MRQHAHHHRSPAILRLATNANEFYPIQASLWTLLRCQLPTRRYTSKATSIEHKVPLKVTRTRTHQMRLFARLKCKLSLFLHRTGFTWFNYYFLRIWVNHVNHMTWKESFIIFTIVDAGVRALHASCVCLEEPCIPRSCDPMRLSSSLIYLNRIFVGCNFACGMRTHCMQSVRRTSVAETRRKRHIACTFSDSIVVWCWCRNMCRRRRAYAEHKRRIVSFEIEQRAIEWHECWMCVWQKI